jgi:uncharacterized membrane protein
MKLALTHTKTPLVGAACALALGAVLVLAASPPLLPLGLGWSVHEAFGLLCHQMADRSFAWGGVSWAVCHRCVGVLAGLAVGIGWAAGYPARAARLAALPLAVLVVAILPAGVDWALEALFGGANTPASRAGTGLWAGLGLGLLAGHALAGEGGAPLAEGPRQEGLETS